MRSYDPTEVNVTFNAVAIDGFGPDIAYASLPAEVLGVDWRIDLPELKCRYPQRAVQGNLEPAILTAGAEATRAAAQELLAATPATGHIVNLGHGILPQTPLASVAALVEAVHSEKL